MVDNFKNGRATDRSRVSERMIKLKGCDLNCVAQGQHVRFKGSRLSPDKPPRVLDLAQAYHPFAWAGSPTGEGALRWHHLTWSPPMTGSQDEWMRRRRGRQGGPLKF